MPRKKLRILILYAKVGGGHESITHGLKERFEEYFNSSVEVILADPTPRSIKLTYQLSATLAPSLYNFMMFNAVAKKPAIMKLLREFQSSMHEEKLLKLIHQADPDLILSTYFLFSEEVKVLLRREGKTIPLVVYIADPFTPHPIWLARDVDLFLSFDKKHLPRGKKLPSIDNKVIPIGMPIRKDFYKIYNKRKTLTSLHFNSDKMTILFGGSGLGIDHLERIAADFRELKLDVQALFLCGRNRVLQRGLRMLFHNNKSVRVFGHLTSEEVASFMQASDLFIGKVGPNVMFETVLSGLVPIATPPMLSQEKGNRKFIEGTKIGFLTESTAETLKLIKKIVYDPSLLEKPRKRIHEERKSLIQKENSGFPQFVKWVQKHCA